MSSCSVNFISDEKEVNENNYPDFITIRIPTQKIHDIKVTDLDGTSALVFNSENPRSLQATIEYSTKREALQIMATIGHQIFNSRSIAKMVATAKGEF